MYLIINNAILPYFIGLVKKEKLISLSFQGERINLLKIIAKFIKKNKIDLSKIKGIIIISDSSSFTKLRLVLTMANISSRFLDIPLSLVRGEKVKAINQAIKQGIKRLKKRIILPVYLAPNF